MGMHTTILGILALATAIGCFMLRQWRLGIGMLFIAVTLGISFLVTIKTLPVDVIGPVLVLVFAVGCAMVVNTALRARVPAVAVCMGCKKGDRLVPIIYGEPRLSVKAASKLGKVKLGGEERRPGDPKWYCKRCDKEVEQP